MAGLPCAIAECDSVSPEATLQELEEEGWTVVAPLGHKPVAVCPYCGIKLDST